MDLMKALIEEIAERDGKPENEIWEEMTDILR